MQKIVKKKWAFIAFSVKAVTGLLGGSLVLTNEHPYLALAVLGIGAIVNEAIDFFELKK
tara:strand:+ start:83 stop:259 length:177 start_codon:yes stop_codon:yes gene_type:complete